MIVFAEERVTRQNNHGRRRDRKSTRLNSSHTVISYAVFCLKKKKKKYRVIAQTHRRLLDAASTRAGRRLRQPDTLVAHADEPLRQTALEVLTRAVIYHPRAA